MISKPNCRGQRDDAREENPEHDIALESDRQQRGKAQGPDPDKCDERSKARLIRKQHHALHEARVGENNERRNRGDTQREEQLRRGNARNRHGRPFFVEMAKA